MNMHSGQLPYLTAAELRTRRPHDIGECLETCEGFMVSSGLGRNIVRDALARLGGDAPKRRLLDCGSASGKFLTDIADDGMRGLYVADLDDYLAPSARAVVREFRAADLSADILPWDNEFFDIITAWCVIPHLENPYHFAREAARVLHSGGLLLVSVPNIRSRSERRQFLTRGNFARYSHTNNHIFVVTDDILDKMMEKNGLRRVATHYHVPQSIFSGPKGILRRKYLDMARRRGSPRDFAYGVVEAAVFEKVA